MIELPRKASYNIRETADLLGFSSRTVCRLIESGDLVAIRISNATRSRRILRQAILDYIASHIDDPLR